ncbi:hypothetical protein [Hymenobacter rubidus]|uniref:hypothetical protein n=1 Tax=Hymenobacter rubidus TaxID=1441626 RepID=UPI00191DD42E|nr:hypothetical protein [Hymenobacter rubidus]
MNLCAVKNLTAAGFLDGGTSFVAKRNTKGILVTRPWYLREVAPQTLLYTGLTRDGTLLTLNKRFKRKKVLRGARDDRGAIYFLPSPN